MQIYITIFIFPNCPHSSRKQHPKCITDTFRNRIHKNPEDGATYTYRNCQTDRRPEKWVDLTFAASWGSKGLTWRTTSNTTVSIKREVSNSNQLVDVSKPWTGLSTLHCSSSPSYTNGGHKCMDGLCGSMAVQLNGTHKSIWCLIEQIYQWVTRVHWTIERSATLYHFSLLIKYSPIFQITQNICDIYPFIGFSSWFKENKSVSSPEFYWFFTTQSHHSPL